MPNAEQNFFADSKTELVAFFTPKYNRKVNFQDPRSCPLPLAGQK